MLHITKATRVDFELENKQIFDGLLIPDIHYQDLKADFKIATHLSQIDHLNLMSTNAVLLKCPTIEDGLVSAGYIIRKWEDDRKISPFHRYTGLDLVQMDEEEEEEDDYSAFMDDTENDYRHIIYDKSAIHYLPIIPWDEFTVPFGIGDWSLTQFGRRHHRPNKVHTLPYWVDGDYPLLIQTAGGLPINRRMVENARRFLIILSPESPQRPLTTSEKEFLFSDSIELCQIDLPTSDYYQTVMTLFAKREGYRIAIPDKGELIENLKKFRRREFRSIEDISTLINKTIKFKQISQKKLTHTLTRADFENVFDLKLISPKNHANLMVRSAKEELEQLIGLKNVKQQILRLVSLLKFNQTREQNGYRTKDFHNAFVFMGNPGTAKTTIARIFGNLLFEENVLRTGKLLEVSRKDLVGQYIGWTAPLVAKVFEQAQGGVLFIDEAYSLMTEGRSDGYSDEAIAEIIRQMENNADTVIIFAGYEDKMRKFIQTANPGLRSRITNVVHFPDYSHAEMFEILKLLASSEDYVLDYDHAHYQVIEQLLKEIEQLKGNHQIGNGRLMRKLLKQAIGFMAERTPQDMKTITVEDITKATIEILAYEKTINHTSGQRHLIGFSTTPKN